MDIDYPFNVLNKIMQKFTFDSYLVEPSRTHHKAFTKMLHEETNV